MRCRVGKTPPFKLALARRKYVGLRGLRGVSSLVSCAFLGPSVPYSKCQCFLLFNLIFLRKGCSIFFFFLSKKKADALQILPFLKENATVSLCRKIAKIGSENTSALFYSTYFQWIMLCIPVHEFSMNSLHLFGICLLRMVF